MKACTCAKQPPLCDDCVDNAVRTLAGVAMSRGYTWGQQTRAVMRTRGRSPERWPAFDESPKVRAIASRKVQDIAKDERLRERLARLCAADAARVYEKKRG